MMFGTKPARIVHRQAGPATTTGSGDILTDEFGRRWKIIEQYEVNALKRSTGCPVIGTLNSDGTIS